MARDDDCHDSLERSDRTDGTDGGHARLRSRRSVLKAAGAVGAGSLALGLGGTASAAKVQEKCDTNYGKIEVADAFTLMDNQWGMSNAPQCIWLNDDDSYGYDFDASNHDGGINYPEVFIGTRPWGDDTGVPEFPVKRKNVDELVMDVEADVSISGGEWDLAEEWWLMEEPPGQQTETHQYEIMLLLDWGGGHDHGTVQDQNAWTDQFGNTVDLWTVYNSGGTDATFYIFRVQGGHNGGKIDMKEIVDYLSANEGISGELYLSGIELGNEYWGGAAGETTYRTFDVTVNGSTYTSGDGGSGGGGSGGGGDGGDATAPTAPTNLSVTGTTSSSVDVDWNASSDSGGSGLNHYEVYVDGTADHTVGSGATATTISGLSADTSYTIGVSAVDGAGNESNSTTVSATTDTGSSGGGGEQLLVNDYDGNPGWPSGNDLGNWNGGGSLQNGGGEGTVTGGELVLEYDNAGWAKEQISQDLSAYTDLVFEIRGASGGEGQQFALGLGGVTKPFADVADGAITTSTSTIRVDMQAAGIDRNSPGELMFDFWQGSSGASTIYVEEIRFE